MTDPSQTSRARQTAAALAALAYAFLALRLALSFEEKGGLLPALSHLSHYFTILTNLLVALMLTAVVLRRAVAPAILLALTISILIVGAVYHVLLAHLVDHQGSEALADQGVHTVVPILTVLWWLAFAPKPPLTLRDPLIWAVWPLIYCVYILIRAAGDGVYPYFFLNLPELGATRLSMNVAGLAVLFIATGYALIGVARLFRRGQVA
ncbi:Pr6Pr family membrane protein [Jannaschia sp. M317]|uniref:Pr6Pr family membrane protein n=1 Tax=Jannaschia sp. M317 TaxID=2867011 RepID=UPI0021A3B8D1|nr:Pr6Pr family membrane protein [Jannaschia sp. M317]UWQ18514.1 Pr6Pr family membrane protein [Jannaschia sp. M317]